MADLDLDTLLALEAKATPGPWVAGRADMGTLDENGFSGKWIYGGGDEYLLYASGRDVRDFTAIVANAQLVASMRNSLRPLVERVQFLEAKLALEEAEMAVLRHALTDARTVKHIICEPSSDVLAGLEAKIDDLGVGVNGLIQERAKLVERVKELEANEQLSRDAFLKMVEAFSLQRAQWGDATQERDRLAAENADLRAQVLGDAAIVRDRRELEQERDRLREALALYAEPKNWVTPSTGFAVQYDPEPSPVDADHGATARRALGMEER